MHTFSHRRWILGGSAILIGLAIGVSSLRLSSDKSQTAQILRLDRASVSNNNSAVAASPTNLVPDDIRQKCDPMRRVEFHVACSRNTSIFVLATGVQVRTSSGWRTFSEEYRGEIWRLKLGLAREVCVERPPGGTWRAYIRYGT